MNEPSQPQSMGPSQPGAIAPWLLITFVIVLLAGGGYLGWYFWNQSQTKTAAPTTTTAIPSTLPSDFNLVFGYGVGAKNQIDTSKNLYTKDMVLDPSVTATIKLSEAEKQIIYNKMVGIDFFNYPDVFTTPITETEVKNPDGSASIPGEVTPSESYYFKVQYDSKTKELNWNDKYISIKDTKSENLRELISTIEDIIKSKPEYKALPEPTSLYD